MNKQKLFKPLQGITWKKMMNKSIYCIVIINMLLFTQVVNAQINLEHTFDGYISHGSYVAYAHNYYVPAIMQTNQIRIYNENYALYKTITITPPTSYTIQAVANISKSITTTDNKVTFFVVFSNTSAPQNQWYTIRLYNEDGTILKDFGFTGITYSTSFHKTADNKYRLSIIKNIDGVYKTDIYSLPGTPPLSPTITTTTLPSGMVGMDYNAVLLASGDAPIVWSLETGNLPGGLNLSAEGIISGIPTETETSNFTLKATNNVGSGTKELSIFIDEETGISMLQMAEVKIFPNPANDKLIIECENIKQNNVILYDMTGKEVLNQNIHGRTEININNLQKGIYIVSIVSENEAVGNFKMVKQ